MKLKDLVVPTERNAYRAHFLKPHSLVLLLLFILIFNSIIPITPLGKVAADVDLNSIVYLHNRERTKYSLNPVTLNTKLIESASRKADVMMEIDCWDHYCPDGTSPWETFKEVGYEYLFAGENLAEGFKENNTMMSAWMNSPTHRENILKPEFSEIGIAINVGEYQKSEDNTLVVAHFGHPVGLPLARSKPPAIVPISQQLDNFASIKILEPIGSQSYSQNNIVVKGEVSVGIVEVAVFEGTKELVRIPVDEGLFQTSLLGSGVELQDGPHTIHARAYSKDGEVIDKSGTITFNIDRIDPELSLNNLKVDAIRQDDTTIVELRLQPYSPDIFTGKILFNNQLITGRVTEESIEFDIPYEALTKSSFMDLIVSDRAGNTSSYKVDQDDVLKEADSLIEELGIPKNKNRLDQVLGVAQLDLAFNIESLSINSVINLSIIVFLIILLLVDFSILYKHNNIHPHRVGHHHLKIGAFIVVAMFILAASGVGSVLDGIQI